MSGTQTGPFMGLGIPATGKSVLIWGAPITKLIGDKVTQNTDYCSLNSTLQKLSQVQE
jgi:hypothetical protein